MNVTTLSNPTTAGEAKENTTQPLGLPVSTKYQIDPGILIGASAGVAGAVTIIIIFLVIVCLIKTRRSRANPPPMLPHPHSLNRFEFNEPSISDHQSDLQGIYTEHSNGFDPMQHVWEVQEPVIHSSTEFPESDRISYIIMSEPARPISLSPPSPEQAVRGSKQVPKRNPPPGPCKSTSGYINIPRNTSGRSPASPAPFRKPSNANGIVGDKVSTKEDENNLDSYENFQEMILAGGNSVHNKFKGKEKSFHNSFLSREIPEHRLPDLLTSTRFHKDFTDAHSVQNAENTAVNHPGDGSFSDSDTPASPEDDITSYVNVGQYKITSPVKESVVIDLSKSPFPKLGNGKSSVLERRSQSKPKPSSLLPKPKVAQPQQPTITAINDTYQINAELYGGDRGRQNNLNQSYRKLSSHTSRKDDIDSNTSGQISPPATKKAAHSASAKFLTTGKIQTKNQLKAGRRSRKNHRSRSHSYQEEAGVYENFMAISISDSKLSQETPTSPASSDLKDIHSRATNDLDTAAEFHLRKPQLHLNKMDETDKTSSQQASALSVLPRSYLNATKFGSSPNVAGSEEINEIRSKLRKVN